jgi:type VI secretion system VasD/TssJ family lipoprotein
MKRAVLVCVFLVPFLWSCASSSQSIKWEYEKDAIALHFKSDKQLNYKDKKAHALVVCVYQLTSPNAFEQLAGSRDGLYKLLECQVFDPASVAVSKQVVASPGKNVEMKLDRAEGAKYVALVAGYYTIDRAKITRLYRIPEVSERSGFLWLKKRYKPGQLDINLILGSRQLQDPKPEGN